jgi:hypothetical protein
MITARMAVDLRRSSFNASVTPEKQRRQADRVDDHEQREEGGRCERLDAHAWRPNGEMVWATR